MKKNIEIERLKNEISACQPKNVGKWLRKFEKYYSEL